MPELAALAKVIYEIVAELPPVLVYRMADLLGDEAIAEWSRRQAIMTGVSPHPAVVERIRWFINQWQAHAPSVSASAMALALRSSATTLERERSYQRVELVWTGPESGIIPLRRTDQALIQLIQEARQSLHIVSFAVYKIEAIVQALLGATKRGVRVTIYLETPDSSDGKVTFDPLGTYGVELARRAGVYIWPLDKRSLSTDGRHGSLHAKLALADDTRLLISSANLTEYALSLNMEAGVLITGGEQPEKVGRHLQRLVETGVFQPVRR